MEIRWSYEEIHGTTPYGDFDIEFYESLPNDDKQYSRGELWKKDSNEQWQRQPSHGMSRHTNAPTKSPEVGIVQALLVSGTATATVTALASLIKTWLKERRSTITVSNKSTGKRISFSGPTLDKKSIDVVKELSDAIGEEPELVDIVAMKKKKKK